jgi:hypothetical protein
MDSHPGNVRDVTSLHRYVYARDNPVNWFDPLGQEAVAVELAGLEIAGVLQGLPQPAEKAKIGYCGEDVTDLVKQTEKDITTTFKKAGAVKKEIACNRMFAPATAFSSWDILWLKGYKPNN